MALTAAFVNTIKNPGKYHDGNRMGLYLLVRPTGGRFWVQRVVIRGTRRELGLGSPPIVTLAEARDQAIKNKRIIREGGDPLAEKNRAKSIPTFEQAAMATHSELAPTWKNEKDAKIFLSSLQRHVFPTLASIPVSEITSSEVRGAILKAREKVPALAKKLNQRISAVMKWSMAEGFRSDNPALAQVLSLPKNTVKPNKMRALPYDQVAECIATINNSGAWIGTKFALEFLILTAARSGEVRGAMWSEIQNWSDVPAKPAKPLNWCIPAERMKMGREHVVPLSPRAIEILHEAMSIRDASGLIFPSVRGKAMSDATMSKLVREQGFDAHVHGFRSSFRTWAQEQTNAPREVAEAALAHVSGDQVERAYARSDLLEKRAMLMDQWASYLAVKKGELVHLHSAG